MDPLTKFILLIFVAPWLLWAFIYILSKAREAKKAEEDRLRKIEKELEELKKRAEATT